MRALTLTKTGLNKVRSFHKELKVSDVEDSLRPIPPGEWCYISHISTDVPWVGFVNSMIDEKYAVIQILAQLSKTEIKNFTPEEFITSTINKAFQQRLRFKEYSQGCRLFYGVNDGLPGLIIDRFYDIAIIQINTAGLDRYRDLIKSTVDKLIDGKSYFLDNKKYRDKEFLPEFTNEAIPQLKIIENQLEYKIRTEVLQKIGFYYDHRENRLQVKNILERLNVRPEKGIDLFSYVGAWGFNALAAGVKEVEFVDQGDFQQEIEANLEINKMEGRGSFIRLDVFKYLDQKIASSHKFDLVMCDPPAFAKSHMQKDQALEGYSKLHRKVFKIAKPGAILSFSSCTHYVNHQEFQKNILEAAHKENKKVQLLSTGIQGWDHPIPSLEDRGCYIKNYIFIME